MSSPKLLTPLKLGGDSKHAYTLSHRITLAPLTRTRAPKSIPSDLQKEYYVQRTTPGGLLVTEGVHPSIEGGNYKDVPGIYTDAQVSAWRQITTAVHAKGGIIFMQLWHVGRLSHSSLLGKKPKAVSKEAHIPTKLSPFVGLPSGTEAETPDEMTIEDLEQTKRDWVAAAQNAIEAGFDGVELHSAGGYLMDQFLEDNLNIRNDRYGGSIENRARFLLEVIDAVVAAIGSYRVGTRFSPFLFFNGAASSDPVPQFQYVVKEVEKRGVAYISMMAPNMSILDMVTGKDDGAKLGQPVVNALAEHTRSNWQRVEKNALESGIKQEELASYLSLASFRQLAKKTPFMPVGGFDGPKAFKAVEEGEADLIAFGRWFISNPDLVQRVAKGVPLAAYDRKTFYASGSRGYTDYKTYEEVKAGTEVSVNA